MRDVLWFAILLGGAPLTQASTVVGGSFVFSTTLGRPTTSSAVLLGPEISIDLRHNLGVGICFAPAGTTCDILFGRTANIVVNETLASQGIGPLTPTGTVVYGGNSYTFGPLLSTPPNTSFILNLSFIGPTVPVVSQTGCVVDPRNCLTFGATNAVPFTMTGTATLISNGNVIFSNLSLSAIGMASYSFTNPPQALEGSATMTFAFAPAEVPEPASYATAVLGLALVGGLHGKITRQCRLAR